jgi:hypothetical protein
MGRAIVALPLWKATVAFRVCREPVKRLSEYGFYVESQTKSLLKML